MLWPLIKGDAKIAMGLMLAVWMAGCDVGGDRKLAEERKDKIIELRIVVPKREVIHGEEFTCTVEFENKHYHPIVFYWYIDGFTDFVTMIITEPNGKRYVIDKSLSSKFAIEWLSFTLKPGEKRAEEFPGDLYCTEPGTVTFEAEFQYLGIKARAEPVKVVVKPKNP